MATDIAGTLVQSTLQQAQKAPDFSGAINQGAELAQHIQNIQTQRSQIEQAKQTLQMQKFDKVASWFETGSKMEDGAAKNAFFSNFVPKGISALGMSDQIDPTSLKMLQSNPEVLAYLKSKVLSGDVKFSDAIAKVNDPDELAKLFPEAKQFTDSKTLAETMKSSIGSLGGIEQKRILEANKYDRSSIMGQVRGQQVANQRDAINLNTHAKALAQVNSKPVETLLGSYQNLDNAVNNFKNGGATAQDFNELQQSVRSNMGIKGQSIGRERADSYARSLGINSDAFWQYVTGKPEDITNASPELVDQILRVAGLEMSNKKQQAAKAMDTASHAYKSFYSRPENTPLHDDFNSTLQSKLSQFSSSNEVNPDFTIAGKKVPLGQAKAFYKANPKFLDRLTPEQRKQLGL